MAGKDLFDEMESQRAWSHARKTAVVQKVLCAIKGCPVDLIPFEEARKLLHLNQKICRGLYEIDLEEIRGSVGRYTDFTSAFLPRSDNISQRWQTVRSAYISEGLPPIELYKIGESFFVLDGNHRVSIARAEGMKTIEAYVCEYITPQELNIEANLDDVLCKAEYEVFLSRTNLKLECDIVFTIPGRYMEIESQIQSVKDSLQNNHNKSVSYEEAAEYWYHEIYSPTVAEIRKSRVLELFPQRTEADLFIWIWSREPEL